LFLEIFEAVTALCGLALSTKITKISELLLGGMVFIAFIADSVVYSAYWVHMPVNYKGRQLSVPWGWVRLLYVKLGQRA
jgi:hypothetical protein